jgi:DNA-directed RNA polymerase I subunit RPA2
MLLESVAAKSGALHGFFPDATPFQFDESNRAVDHFGEHLKKAGYSYYGNETMYSGTLGTEFKADIFLGVVYYQRLRHMVLDKFQARSTGKTNSQTHQPLKGRKKGGGIRFGEMERDGLLSYGASFLIRDRLFQCSDEDSTEVCTKCGGLLNVTTLQSGFAKDNICRMCDTGKYLERIQIPYVFKYLANELASMNIQVKVEINDF